MNSQIPSRKFLFMGFLLIVFFLSFSSQNELTNEENFVGEENISYSFVNYDMYVFTLQWGPNFCLFSQDQESCEAKLAAETEKNNLSIHGLWPSLINGDKLRDCNTGDQIPITDQPIEPFLTMRQVWPSLNQNSNDAFWTHEFNKHGFCYTNRYNLKTMDFFNKTLELYNKYNLYRLIKDTLAIKEGQTVEFDTNDLIQKFSASQGGLFFDLICGDLNGTQYLQEIRFYLDLNFDKYLGHHIGNTCDLNTKTSIKFSTSTTKPKANEANKAEMNFLEKIW